MNSIIKGREAEIARIAESEERAAALQKHIQEIIESTAFKGSPRCGRFLKYIVDQAIAGRFASLKERVIGVDLLGRSPSYDTGEDATVRVTASEVRKRLLQYYGGCETAPEFRISLPLGSYIPEIIREYQSGAGSLQDQKADQYPPTAPLGSAAPRQDSALVSIAVKETVADAPAAADRETSRSSHRSRRRWLSVTVPLAVLNVVLLGVVWNRFLRTNAAPVSVLPWSVLFSSPHPTRVITSDPEIVTIQGMTGRRISLLDYVKHNYIPEHNTLTPEMEQILLNTPRGDWAAPLDMRIALNVAELAQSSSRKIGVQPASEIQLSDLKTDDNFIFLGSPRSDPWVSLFNDRLDFQFSVNEGSQNEVIRNVHPKPNEQSIYIPTIGTTGESFAIVAFVQNPDQDGQVLILAGATGEGTQVAARLVTDLPRLSMALQKCGIPPSGPLKHFELLLSVNIMAGSSRGFDVIACHVLPATSPY